MMTEKIDIKSLSYTELETFITELGGQKFRTGQVFGWLHQKHVTSFDEMSNLSKNFREKLEQTCSIVNLKPPRSAAVWVAASVHRRSTDSNAISVHLKCSMRFIALNRVLARKCRILS